MKTSIFLLFSILVIGWQTNANLSAVYNSLERSVREGNEKRIIFHAGEKILLEIDNVESVYSKPQAEQILRDFFEKNKPSEFEVSFRGTNKNNFAMIGTLVTEKSKKFRVSIRLKESGNTFILEKLSINPL
jgi:hypothetical protein